MLEPNSKIKETEASMKPEEVDRVLNDMYADVTFIWRNCLLAFIMSVFEHSSELLALRIVDKCSVKSEKTKAKKSHGFS